MRKSKKQNNKICAPEGAYHEHYLGDLRWDEIAAGYDVPTPVLRKLWQRGYPIEWRTCADVMIPMVKEQGGQLKFPHGFRIKMWKQVAAEGYDGRRMLKHLREEFVMFVSGEYKARTTVKEFQEEPPDTTDESDLDIEDLLTNGKIPPEHRMKLAQLKERIHKAEKVKLEVERQRGTMISLAEAREQVMMIGSGIKAAMLRFENDLPPLLEGLTAEEMVPVVRREVDAILNLWSSADAFPTAD